MTEIKGLFVTFAHSLLNGRILRLVHTLQSYLNEVL
jgi:hypothetical protein